MSIDLLVRKAWSNGLAVARGILRKPAVYSVLAVGLACGGADSRYDPSILITDAATDASSDGSRYDGPRRMGKIERDMQVSGKDMSSGVGNDLGTDMYSPRGDAYSRNDVGVDKAADASSVRGADGRSYADASYDSGAENDLGAERIDAARADEGLRARTDGLVRADAGILADSGYFPDTGAGADLGGDAAPDAVSCGGVIDNRIVFGSTRDGNFEIYRMNSDGSEVERLTNDPARDFYPRWSPGREMISFVRDGNIHIMNSDGSNVRPLIIEGISQAARHSWSPDGARIVFEGTAGIPSSEPDIYIVSLDGTSLEQITENPAIDGTPSWSPCGDRIAFASTRDGSYELYTMNPNGTDIMRITFRPGHVFPDWLYDASRIASSSDESIWIMNQDGTDQRRITNGFEMNDHFPDWSPDGRRIAFNRDIREIGRQIYIVEVDNPENILQLTTEGQNMDPDW